MFTLGTKPTAPNLGLPIRGQAEIAIPVELRIAKYDGTEGFLSVTPAMRPAAPSTSAREQRRRPGTYPFCPR